MPDALSKTIPMWCAVMNMVVFPDAADCRRLHTPPTVISDTEKSQMEARLGDFADRFKDLKVDLSGIKSKICKPIRPIWVTRDSMIPEHVPDFESFYPLVLCTSSRRVSGAEISEGGYIQGAGDDSESWAFGLTPPIFWKHKDILLNTPEESISSVIANLMEQVTLKRTGIDFINIKQAHALYIGAIPDTGISQFQLGKLDILITCAPESPITAPSSQHLHLACREGKLGSRELRSRLQSLLSFLSSIDSVDKIYVACPNGKDLSVGVALAILCLCFDDQGQLTLPRPGQKLEKMTKLFIRQRLTWITTTMPQANPSNATLQSINDFLFQSRCIPDIPKPKMYQATDFDWMSNLEGVWNLDRTLKDHLIHHSLNTFVIGTVSWTPIASITGTNSDIQALLYTEIGKMRVLDGSTVDFHRKWIWRVQNQAKDDKPTLSVWFVKPDSVTADYLYHDLIIKPATTPEISPSGEQVLSAEASHLCVKDDYKAKYFFTLSPPNHPSKAPQLTKIMIEHQVTGPSKDYTSTTTLTPNAY